MTSYSFHRVIALPFLIPLSCHPGLFHFFNFFNPFTSATTATYNDKTLRAPTSTKSSQSLPSTITHIYMMKPSPYLFPRLTRLLRHAPSYPPVIVHTTSAGKPTQTASETDQATGPWWIHIHQNTIPTIVRIPYTIPLYSYSLACVLTCRYSVFNKAI